MLSLKEKIDFALKEKVPFTSYRKPNLNLINFISQKNDKLNYLTSFEQKGFVFAPFDTNRNSIFFPLNQSNFFSFLVNEPEFLDKEATDFQITPTDKHKKNHIELVKKGIQFIKNSKVQKIVLSRKEVFTKPNFDCIKTYFRLLKTYPTAFVYVWFHPKVGLWLGATPETLLQVKNNIFNTMALAGTQEFKNTLNVKWQNKEVEEQKLVVDYISDKLTNLNINFKISKTYTVKAGSVLHLRSDILGRIKNKNQLELIIKALHPTPAICGLPKEKAKQFILDNENYDREYYTGFLGELNFENSRKNNHKNIENQAYRLNKKTTTLFVNLRCMQVVNDKIKLYLGGGITKDSNAENEFLETVVKSKIIKKCL